MRPVGGHAGGRNNNIKNFRAIQNLVASILAKSPAKHSRSSPVIHKQGALFHFKCSCIYINSKHQRPAG